MPLPIIILIMAFFKFSIIAFCGRDSGSITPLYNTKLLMVAKNMCVKFQQDILIFTQVTACMDGRTDR